MFLAPQNMFINAMEEVTEFSLVIVKRVTCQVMLEYANIYPIICLQLHVDKHEYSLEMLRRFRVKLK